MAREVNDFVQEYLYIEEFPVEMFEKKDAKPVEAKRGIEIISIFGNEEDKKEI